MNGHHIYIKDGKILAGSVPGASGVKKATKAQLAGHQATVDKGAGKGESKKKATGKKGDVRPDNVGSSASGNGNVRKPATTSKPSTKTAKDSKPVNGAKKNGVKAPAKKPKKVLGAGVARFTPEEQARIDKHVALLKERYPVLKDQLKFVGDRGTYLSTQTKRDARVPTTKTDTRSAAYGVPAYEGNKQVGQAVVLNPEHITDGKLAKEQSAGRLYGSTLEDMINHEVGHGIDRIVGTGHQWDTNPEVAKFLNKWRPKASDISKYAATNDSELFAELFSAHMKGNNTPMVKEFGSMVDKLLGVAKKQPKLVVDPVKPKQTPKKPKAGVADVRTKGQATNQLAYDVGKEVFGSRKDLATLRDDLNSKIAKGESVRGVLANLEKIDPGAAKKYCIKDNILQKYDWEAQHKQGVDLKVAMAKKLIFDRIQPKPELDNPETRRQYAYAIEELHRLMAPIKTMDELKGLRRTLRDRMSLETPKHLVDNQRYLDYAKKEAAKTPTEWDLKGADRVYNKDGSVTRSDITAKEWKKRKEATVKEREATVAEWHKNAQNPYHVLGDKLTAFFTDADSANRTFDTIAKKNPSWDDYLSPQQREAKPKRNRKAEWERKVEDPFFRSGGRAGKVQKPEDAVKQFGLRGVQFGHWVDDTSGKFHLLKASEALQDMADVLGMKDSEVSLNGRLALAFGARGVGGSGAVAHYEPNLRVINLTKMGGAGSLAHEWGHAMDDILGDHSGIAEYASENPDQLKNPEIKSAYTELMNAIEKGDGTHKGTTTVANDNKPRGRYYPSYQKAVRERGLAPEVISHFAKQINDRYDAEKDRLERYVASSGSEAAKKKLKTIESGRKREINSMHQELMYHHEKHTQTKVESMEVPTSGSEYFNRMKELDGERSKPYYSTGREMFARVFESWMQQNLNDKGTKNNYLVSGTSEKYMDDVDAHNAKHGMDNPTPPFPRGSERKDMFAKMGKLMKAIVGTGEIKKALEFDLQKGNVFDRLWADSVAKGFNPSEKRDEHGRWVEGIMEHNAMLTKHAHRFGSAEEFADNVNRPGFGGKSTGDLFGMIDANSHNHLDANAIKTYLSEGGEYYYLTHVDPKVLEVENEGYLTGIHTTPFDQASAKPIVVGQNNFIVDGRHRTVNAKQSGASRILAYVPAKAYYNLHVRGNEFMKSVITDPTSEPGSGGLPDDPNTMYRGIGQKELDAIYASGFVQTKGKGNDDDKGKRTTCFTNLYTQAEGYARTQYSQYGETAAYVIALPKPPWVYEDEHGELLSDSPVPFAIGVIIAIDNPDRESDAVVDPTHGVELLVKHNYL